MQHTRSRSNSFQQSPVLMIPEQGAHPDSNAAQLLSPRYLRVSQSSAKRLGELRTVKTKMLLLRRNPEGSPPGFLSGKPCCSQGLCRVSILAGARPRWLCGGARTPLRHSESLLNPFHTHLGHSQPALL
jgi:hypothetical protein